VAASTGVQTGILVPVADVQGQLGERDFATVTATTAAIEPSSAWPLLADIVDLVAIETPSGSGI
jgi:hypothetical protein